MKKYNGVLLALSPFFVYGAVSVPGYLLEIFKLFFSQIPYNENFFGDCASGIWIISAIFFPLGIAMLQYTKNLFRLWLIPVNLLGLILGSLAVYFLILPYDEDGASIALWLTFYLLVYAAVVNLIFAVIYIIKKHKEKAKKQTN